MGLGKSIPYTESTAIVYNRTKGRILFTGKNGVSYKVKADGSPVPLDQVNVKDIDIQVHLGRVAYFIAGKEDAHSKSNIRAKCQMCGKIEDIVVLLPGYGYICSYCCSEMTANVLDEFDGEIMGNKPQIPERPSRFDLLDL